MRPGIQMNDVDGLSVYSKTQGFILSPGKVYRRGSELDVVVDAVE